VLSVAAIWASRSGVPVGINSLNDHRHQRRSLHFADLAVDLDTQGDHPHDLYTLWVFLTASLDTRYDVIHEGDHIHVEYDQ